MCDFCPKGVWFLPQWFWAHYKPFRCIWYKGISIHYSRILDLTHSEPLLTIFVHLIKMHAKTHACLCIHYHSLHYDWLHSRCILIQRIQQHLECILHLLHTVTDALSMHSMGRLHLVTFIFIRKECIVLHSRGVIALRYILMHVRSVAFFTCCISVNYVPLLKHMATDLCEPTHYMRSNAYTCSRMYMYARTCSRRWK